MKKRKMFLSLAFLSTLIISSCTVVANSSQASKESTSVIEDSSICFLNVVVDDNEL